jgi:hypothetical protein
MIATRQWRPTLLVAFWFCLLAAPSSALASPNATIINGDVQLRKSYPSFGVSTLLRFQLAAGPILTIIPKGSRVEVSSKRIVAKTQEWFETTYVTGTRKFVEERLPVAAGGGRLTQSEMLADAMQLLFSPPAHAQPVDAGVEPPPAKTDPIRTLLLGLAYVVIFIGSLFTTKKWVFPTSDTYAFLTSLCVLLILGFISETALSNVIAKVIAK